MMRLRALVRRLLVHLVPIKPIQVQEDVCWCGIHHLGPGYVHLPPPRGPAPLSCDGTRACIATVHLMNCRSLAPGYTSIDQIPGAV